MRCTETRTACAGCGLQNKQPEHLVLSPFCLRSDFATNQTSLEACDQICVYKNATICSARTDASSSWFECVFWDETEAGGCHAMNDSPTSPLTDSTPSPTCEYVVQPGDTAFNLAVARGCTLEDLGAANAGTDLEHLQVGQILGLPAACNCDVAQGPDVVQSDGSMFWHWKTCTDQHAPVPATSVAGSGSPPPVPQAPVPVYVSPAPSEVDFDVSPGSKGPYSIAPYSIAPGPARESAPDSAGAAGTEDTLINRRAEDAGGAPEPPGEPPGIDWEKWNFLIWAPLGLVVAVFAAWLAWRSRSRRGGHQPQYVL